MTIKLSGRKYLLNYLDKKCLVNRTFKYFCWAKSLVGKKSAVNRESTETSELTIPMQMTKEVRKYPGKCGEMSNTKKAFSNNS